MDFPSLWLLHGARFGTRLESITQLRAGDGTAIGFFILYVKVAKPGEQAALEDVIIESENGLKGP